MKLYVHGVATTINHGYLGMTDQFRPIRMYEQGIFVHQAPLMSFYISPDCIVTEKLWGPENMPVNDFVRILYYNSRPYYNSPAQ